MNTNYTAPLRNRSLGAVLGLACGDALGAPAEFKTQAQVQQNFGQLRDMVGGGPWETGEWTDDTGMMLCMAEGIFSNYGDPVSAVGKRFLQWQETAKDVGSTISAALNLVGRYRGDWFQAAQNTDQARSGMAAGNGSLMRCLPAALAYSDQGTMLKQSARLSAMTHWDAQAETCCAIYCLWIDRLLQGEPMREGWNAALGSARALAAGTPPAHGTPGWAPLSSSLWERLGALGTLSYDQLQPSGYAGYVVECLEAAVWCCLHGDSLENTLIMAVNLAGEADTIAAVAGGAAGAFWGDGAIPQRWLNVLHERERLEIAAEKLAVRHCPVTGYEHPEIKAFEFSWIAPRLIAGRNPLLAKDVDALVSLGVTDYLDIREGHEYAGSRLGAEALLALAERRIVREHLPFTDMGAPSQADLQAAVTYLETTLADPKKCVYVSCRAGIERTATVLIAFYAKRHGVGYDQALRAVRQQRPALLPLREQEKAVRDFVAST